MFIFLNRRTRIGEPIAPDLKIFFRMVSLVGETTIAPTADVPRLIRDTGTHSDVRFNREALTSASSYWLAWSSGLGRLSQCTAGHSARTWHMLVEDVFHLKASGPCLSWNKTAGADIVLWVRFELTHKTYHLEISACRTEWFARWTGELDHLRSRSGPRAVCVARLLSTSGRLLDRCTRSCPCTREDPQGVRLPLSLSLSS